MRSLLAFLVGLAMALSACQTETTPTTPPPGIPGSDTTNPVEVATTTTRPPARPLRIGVAGSLTTDNWWAAQDTAVSSANVHLEGGKPSLFTLSFPGFVHIPGVADTPTPAQPVQEGNNWVVTQEMRRDLVWSDGEPITAHDLVFYFDTVREFDLGAGHALSFPPEVVSITAVDDHTVRVVFSVEPGLRLWSNGVGFASFVAAHFWQTHVETARSAAADVVASTRAESAIEAIVRASIDDFDPGNDLTNSEVTQPMIADYIARLAAERGRETLYSASGAREPSFGAHTLNEWSPGSLVSQIPNPEFEDSGDVNILYSDGSFRIVGDDGEDRLFGGDGSGEVLASYVMGPHTSEIVFLEYPSRDAAYEALASGEVEFVVDPTGLTVEERDSLAANPDVIFPVNQADGFRYLAFNLRRAPMSDRAFRQAVATVINKELIAQSILSGAVFPAYTVIHPDLTAFYNPDVSRPGWSEGADAAPLSQTDRFLTAMQILEDAGYTWAREPVVDPGGDNPVQEPGVGLTMPNGQPVPTLVLLTPGPEEDPFRHAFSVFIDEWMGNLGVPVSLAPSDLDSILARVSAPEADFDLYVLGWGGGDPSLPDEFIQFFSATQDSVRTGGSNYPGYNDAVFEEMVVRMNQAQDTATVASIAKEMEARIAQDLPYVVLFRSAVIEAQRTNVRIPVEYVMGGYREWVSALTATARVDGP